MTVIEKNHAVIPNAAGGGIFGHNDGKRFLAYARNDKWHCYAVRNDVLQKNNKRTGRLLKTENKKTTNKLKDRYNAMKSIRNPYIIFALCGGLCSLVRAGTICHKGEDGMRMITVIASDCKERSNPERQGNTGLLRRLCLLAMTEHKG